MEANDEITQYQEARYVGSMEAAMRILGFPIHQRYPPVFQLSIHLENGQRVYFTEENARRIALGTPPKTMLTAFFTLCQTDDFAQSLLYVEVPQYYTWHNKAKKWNRRKQGVPSESSPGVFRSPCLGRVYTISPKQRKCYYMRLLLHEKRGPKSYKDLKTFNEVEFDTYHATCLAMGLIDNDQHYHRALEEAALANTGHHLRKLFTMILTACEPSDPLTLWEQHKHHISDDLFYKAGLPPDHEDKQALFAADKEKSLTGEQKTIATDFLHMVNNKIPGIVFLDAPGGTGKTFLLKYLLHTIRSKGWIVIACASSGIAARLIPGGKTLHSTFKIPLDVQYRDHPTCSINKNSALASILRETRGLIVDEALMTHKSAYEAMDYTLRDITAVASTTIRWYSNIVVW
ncbi:uncharacterized protein [Antedon mediterranea]|uniref:uncharacterized protein n=1 Tax=Antedon mediterranea TaxID=105859 RepID=UPI003AF96066